MAERRVTRTRKDYDGDITALCNHGAYWSPREKADAIRDIERNNHRYYVESRWGRRTYVQVVSGPTGKYLRTVADPSSDNNLDNLPDC